MKFSGSKVPSKLTSSYRGSSSRVSQKPKRNNKFAEALKDKEINFKK